MRNLATSLIVEWDGDIIVEDATRVNLPSLHLVDPLDPRGIIKATVTDEDRSEGVL